MAYALLAQTADDQGSEPLVQPPSDSGAFLDEADHVYRCQRCAVVHVAQLIGAAAATRFKAADAATATARSSCAGRLAARLTSQIDDASEDGDRGEVLQPFSRRFVPWPRGYTPELDDDAELETDPAGRLSDAEYSSLLHRGAPDGMIQRYSLEFDYETGIVATVKDFYDADDMLFTGEVGTLFESVRMYLGRVVLVDDDDADGSRFVSSLYRFVECQQFALPSRKEIFDERFSWTVTLPDSDGPPVPVIKLTLPRKTELARCDSDAESEPGLRRSGDDGEDGAKLDAQRRKYVRAIVSDDEEDELDDGRGGEDEVMEDVKPVVVDAVRSKAAEASPWCG